MRKNQGLYLRGKTWWICYADVRGHLVRESAYTPHKAVAERLLALRRGQAVQNKLPAELRTRTVHRLAVVIAEYLAESKATKRSWRNDVRWGANWTARMGQRGLDDIASADIEAWRRTRLAEGVTAATCNREHAFLRRVLNVAMRDGRCLRNAAAMVKLLREPSGRIRFLTEEEERLLRSCFDPDKWKYALLAILTGLRQGEQAGLRREHVDFRNGLLKIPRSKHGEARYVEMHDRVRAILTDQLAGHTSPWVYPGKKPGAHLTEWGFRQPFERARKQAGLDDLRWHDLRHTFISRLVMSGADMVTVKELAGHKTMAMTMRYAHLSPEHRRSAINRLVVVE